MKFLLETFQIAETLCYTLKWLLCSVGKTEWNNSESLDSESLDFESLGSESLDSESLDSESLDSGSLDSRSRFRRGIVGYGSGFFLLLE